jgi:hypothetical protein
MNLAYVVSAYTLPDQLVSLVRKLNGVGAHVFIHVGRQTDDRVCRCMEAPLSSPPFLPRHRSHYSGFGHVRATVQGMTEFFQRHLPFDYTILLAG